MENNTKQEILAESIAAIAMTAHEISKLPEQERDRVLRLRGAYMKVIPKELNNEEQRAYYLKEAEGAMKDKLPITAKQCLENARAFGNLGKTDQLPTTKEDER